jgi:hypothetical protein
MANIAINELNSKHIPVIIKMIKIICDNYTFDIKTRYELICSLVKIYDNINVETEDNNIKEMIIDLKNIKDVIDDDKYYNNDYEFKMSCFDAVWLYSNSK